MVLQRFLDGIETHVQNTPNVYFTKYEGSVDQGLMVAAFRYLCDTHPVLLGRVLVDEKDGRHRLRAPVCEEPDVRIRRGGRSEYLAESQSAWDSSLSLARLLLIEDDTSGYVALRLDHAIADGRAGLALVDELWRNYVSILRGEAVLQHGPATLPVQPYEMLVGRFGVSEPEPSLPVYSQSTAGCMVARHRSLHMSAAQTASLVEAARRAGVSVHSYVCGAIVAAQRVVGGAPSEQAPMRCWSPIDLRSRVEPQVGATETTNFLAFHCADLCVKAGDRPADIGRRIKTGMEAAIEGRDIFLVAEVAPPLPIQTPVDQRLAHVFVTNLGVVPTLPSVSGVEIIDVGSTMFEPVFLPAYVVHAYNGQLVLDFHLPYETFSDGELTVLFDETLSQLNSTSLVG